jgi:hypothetical protein
MSKYYSTATKQDQRVRLVLIIERGIKRALAAQSIKHGCEVRPDSGSMNERARKYIMDGLKRDGVNVDAIIKSGL